MNFLIEETDVERVERVMRRLFTETRLNGDEMRDLAQALEIVSRHVREIPIPQDAGHDR